MLAILSTFFPHWVFKALISVDGNVSVSFFPSSISFLFTCSLQRTEGKILAASDISDSELFVSWSWNSVQAGCRMKDRGFESLPPLLIGIISANSKYASSSKPQFCKILTRCRHVETYSRALTFRSRHVMINLISIKRMTIRVVRMMFIIIFFTDTLKPIQELSTFRSSHVKINLISIKRKTIERWLSSSSSQTGWNLFKSSPLCEVDSEEASKWQKHHQHSLSLKRIQFKPWKCNFSFVKPEHQPITTTISSYPNCISLNTIKTFAFVRDVIFSISGNFLYENGLEKVFNEPMWTPDW